MAVANSQKVTVSCIDFLKTQTDTVILFYSGGKDSLVLLDMLTKHFTVKLAFMYFVDGLQHVEKYLHFAQKKYGVEFKKYPHWMLCQYFNDNYFRFHSDPVPNIKLADIENQARRDFNCKWIVSGMKKADSLNRRLMLGTFFMHSIDLKGHRAYPLSEWKKADCLNYIKLHRLPMPVAYNSKNSSGMDLNADVLNWCKKNAPEDYKKILRQFPFAETIILNNGNQ
ncbi:MAG: phosphoadenosine phosphosulfate reductase family protein [Chitinophagaceae bacterium]|nr:phosphoadenosine phosphosulfate reductase family protein [Chitinophagaceae bacterium]